MKIDSLLVTQYENKSCRTAKQIVSSPISILRGFIGSHEGRRNLVGRKVEPGSPSVSSTVSNQITC